MEKIITIFGSGLINPAENQYKCAENVGLLLAQNKYTICSGGYGGIMEAVSKGAKSIKGKTIGITLDIPERSANKYIDENVIMPNWVERLMELIAIGDAYIVFNGGSGTLVELSAIIEMMNKKVMKEKPLLFYKKYWTKVIDSIKNESKSLNNLITQKLFFIKKENDVLKILRKNKV
jgi:uncharacterized protein (TIGR00725 family)